MAFSHCGIVKSKLGLHLMRPIPRRFGFGSMICLLLVVGSHCGSSDSESAEDEETDEPATQTLERLYVGTGEYSARQDWHAVLRFDDSASINSVETNTAVTPDTTVNVQSSGDSSGVLLNFAHTLFLDEERDELYLGALFTTSDNHDCSGTSEVCGSISVMSNASTVSGESQTVSRHLFGSETEINQPHGIWVDTSRDILYAANTFSLNILVWDNASTVDGNTAPDRMITYSEMGAPVYVYVDSEADRLFVAGMNGGTGAEPSVMIFNNASTLDGEQTPSIRIRGEGTRLQEGNNQTTHNAWYDSGTQLLFVGHHINEILIYDLADVNFSPSSTPTDLDLTPRVVKVNEEADDSDQYQWSVYGLFYLPSQDRLYVAASYQANGNAQSSGPPQAGSPEQAIKIYDNISDSSMSGLVIPTREIWWDNGDQYYPAQPLWVQEYEAPL